MKSKLTLRLDKDLKERAKQLADRRGTSVSKIVEHYFKLLLREDSSDTPSEEVSSSGEGVSSSEDRSNGDQSGADQSGVAALETTLSPRIRRLKEKLGKPAPEVEMDGDTRRWVEAAAEKHA